MNKRQKIIVSIVGIFIVVLALVGITYGYFLTRIIGNTNDTSVIITTALLELKYDDEDNTIELSNLVPGGTIPPKTFSVENTGQGEVEYGVYLENIINELEKQEDLTYSITCVSETLDSKVTPTPKDCNGKDSTQYPETNTQVLTNTIEPRVKHNYTLTIVYRDLGNQSVDMGKTIEGKVQIYAVNDVFDVEVDGTNLADTDVLELHSEVKTARKVNGKYKFVGVMPDEHKLTVKNSNGSEKGTTDLTIALGTSESYSNGTVNVTKNTKKFNISIANITNNKVNVDVSFESNPFEVGTFAYKILDSAKKAKNENDTVRTKYSPTPLTEPGTAIDSEIVSGYEIVTESDNTGLNGDATVSVAIGTGYELNQNTGKFTLTGVTTCKLSDCDFTNKYIKYVSDFWSSSTNTDNLDAIMHITNADFQNYEDFGYYGTINFTKITSEEKSSLYVNENETVLSIAKDDYSNSYYFRGAPKDNYVTINNTCWRIVRVQGDSSIRLILSDYSNACSSKTLKNAKMLINLSSSGWYDDGNSVNGNTMNSLYNLLSEASELSGIDKNKLKLNNNYFVADRVGNSYNDIANELVSDGTKLNDSYVTLLNVDEALYSGLTIDDYNNKSNSYLFEHYYNSEGNYLFVINAVSLGVDEYSWDYPVQVEGVFYGENYELYSFITEGMVSTSTLGGFSEKLRPVISLDNSKVSVTGTGTIDDPYVVS